MAISSRIIARRRFIVAATSNIARVAYDYISQKDFGLIVTVFRTTVASMGCKVDASTVSTSIICLCNVKSIFFVNLSGLDLS